jgi:GBP family porin
MPPQSGTGIAAFDAGVYTLTPATGNQHVVVAVGLKHRFWYWVALQG